MLREHVTVKRVALLYGVVVAVLASIVWRRAGLLRALAFIGVATLVAVVAIVVFYVGWIVLWLAMYGLEEILIQTINWLLRDYEAAESLDEVPDWRRAITSRLSGFRRGLMRRRVNWLEPGRQIVK